MELSAAFDPNSSESVDKLYRQIKFETDKFVDLPIVYNKLKQQGFIKKIYDLFSEIFIDEKNFTVSVNCVWKQLYEGSSSTTNQNSTPQHKGTQEQMLNSDLKQSAQTQLQQNYSSNQHQEVNQQGSQFLKSLQIQDVPSPTKIKNQKQVPERQSPQKFHKSNTIAISQSQPLKKLDPKIQNRIMTPNKQFSQSPSELTMKSQNDAEDLINSKKFQQNASISFDKGQNRKFKRSQTVDPLNQSCFSKFFTTNINDKLNLHNLNSEFSYITGGVSRFQKAKRDVWYKQQVEKQASVPGPGSYEPSKADQIVRTSNKKPTFSKAEKVAWIDEHVAKNQGKSPGAKYNPTHHYLSKKSNVVKKK